MSRSLRGVLCFAIVFFATPIGAARARAKGVVDLDVVKADLPNTLRFLADVGHVNLVIGDEVTGAVTVKLKAVRWDEAMTVIARARGYEIEREGSIYRVASAATFERERAAKISARDACLATAPLQTTLIPVAYADAKAMVALLQPTLTKRGSVVVDERTNTLIVRDVVCD